VGSCFAEDPRRCAREAVILFDACTDCSVLGCDVIAGEGDFDLSAIGCFSALLRGQEACEHLVVADGMRRIRLDVTGGTMLDGPVRLCFRLEGLMAIEAPLLTLRRLSALSQLRRMPRLLFPADRRAPRGVLALRAGDAWRCGASQREVAEAIFGGERVRSEWNGSSDYMRSQVRRMLRHARRMTGGGWRALVSAADVSATPN